VPRKSTKSPKENKPVVEVEREPLFPKDESIPELPGSPSQKEIESDPFFATTPKPPLGVDQEPIFPEDDNLKDEPFFQRPSPTNPAEIKALAKKKKEAVVKKTPKSPKTPKKEDEGKPTTIPSKTSKTPLKKEDKKPESGGAFFTQEVTSEGTKISKKPKVDIEDSAIEKFVQGVTRPITLFSRKIVAKIFGDKISTPEEEETRKSLVGISTRFKNTYSIIEQNSKVFSELAKDNKRIQEMMQSIEDPKNLQLVQKLIEGKQVFPEEAKDISEYWDKIINALKDIGVVLEVKFGTLLSSAESIIKDSKVDFKTRRDLIKNIVSVATDAKIDSEALRDLKAVNIDQTNFSEEQVSKLTEIIKRLEPDVSEIKITGTVEQINKKLGAFTIDQHKMSELMEEQVTATSTFGEQFEKFRKQGMGALQSQAGKGLLRSALNLVGLGGIEDVIGDLWGLGGLVKGGASVGLKGLKLGGKALSGGMGLGKGILSKSLGYMGLGGGGALSAAGQIIPQAGGAAVMRPGIFGRVAGALGGGIGSPLTTGGIVEGTARPGILGKLGGFFSRGVSPATSGGIVEGATSVAKPSMLSKLGGWLGKGSTEAASAKGVGSLGKAATIGKGAMGAVGKVGSLVSRFAAPLAGAVTFGTKLAAGEGVGKAATGAGGSMAGAAIGASLGSVVPVVGTLVGGAIGAAAGEWLGDKAYDFFDKGGATKIIGKLKSALSAIMGVITSIGNALWSVVKGVGSMLSGAAKILKKILSYSTPFALIFKLFDKTEATSTAEVAQKAQAVENPGFVQNLRDWWSGNKKPTTPEQVLGSETVQKFKAVAPVVAKEGGFEAANVSPSSPVIERANTMNTKSADLARSEAAVTRAAAVATKQSQGKPIIVPVPMDSGKNMTAPNKINSVDDNGLALIGSGVFD